MHILQPEGLGVYAAGTWGLVTPGSPGERDWSAPTPSIRDLTEKKNLDNNHEDT